MGFGIVRPSLSRSQVLRKVHLVTTVDPTAIDDADDGYQVGMLWTNKDAGQTWHLDDATPGAAVWVAFGTGFGTGGAPIAVRDEDSPLTAAVVSFEFTGAGVTAQHLGGGQVRVSIPGGGGAGGGNSYFPTGW